MAGFLENISLGDDSRSWREEEILKSIICDVLCDGIVPVSDLKPPAIEQIRYVRHNTVLGSFQLLALTYIS